MITYLERTEIVPIGVQSDFARVNIDSKSQAEINKDIKDLALLIPNGKTIKHFCYHPEGKSCISEDL